VERQHAEATSLNKRDAVGESVETQALAEVTGQYQNEMAKRMDAQNKLLQKDQQVRELQRQVDAMRDASGAISRAPSCDGELAVHEAKKQRELAEKESQLRELQQQLDDEFTRRAELQGQVVEKDKQLREMQFVVEDSDLYRHQAMQEQLLQKTRELCDLQAQLTQELALRQSVQYKVIEKERAICELQKQLMTARGASTESSFVRSSSVIVPAAGVGDGSSYEFGTDGGVSPASPREPEGEDSTYQAGTDSSRVSPPVASPPTPIGGFGPPIPLGEQPSLMPSVRSTPSGSLRTPPAFDSPAFMPRSMPIRTVTMPCSSSTNVQEVRGSSADSLRNQHNIAWWGSYYQPNTAASDETPPISPMLNVEGRTLAIPGSARDLEEVMRRERQGGRTFR